MTDPFAHDGTWLGIERALGKAIAERDDALARHKAALEERDAAVAAAAAAAAKLAEYTAMLAGPERSRVLVRGVDFDCEYCGALQGLTRDGSWHRCNACGEPSK